MGGPPFDFDKATFSGRERQQAGFVTTWENDEGKTVSFHRTGTVRFALPVLIEDVLFLDPSFRLVAYSTPETILSDVTGGRADFTNNRGGTSRKHLPELGALALVGEKACDGPVHG